MVWRHSGERGQEAAMAIGNSDGGDCQLEVATDRTARLARRWQQRFWRRGELIILLMSCPLAAEKHVAL